MAVCIHTHTHIYIHIYHIFLYIHRYIHTSYPSSVIICYDHIRCFHVLASINSAAITEGCMSLFVFEFCLDICPGVGLLDHMVVLFLVF